MGGGAELEMNRAFKGTEMDSPLIAPAWTEDALFAAMQSVAAPRSCCYLAGPLTSSEARLMGRSHLSWTEIESNNRARMQEIAGNLRRRLDYPVIDSSVLQVPGWSGSDYGRFFLRVMEELCFEIRFIDGWEYSMGATKEFVRAQELRIPCFNEGGVGLTIDDGIGLIDFAVRNMESLGIESSRYAVRLKSLRELR
jgi:hypothetical protein